MTTAVGNYSSAVSAVTHTTTARWRPRLPCTATRVAIAGKRAVTGKRDAAWCSMSNRTHRTQKTDLVSPDDRKPMVVRPLVNIEDRVHNPKDIDVDTAAIRNGTEHGGTIESHAATRATRGSGGRKRSGGLGRPRAGRDASKRRH
jgi:hypothetical protein